MTNTQTKQMPKDWEQIQIKDLIDLIIDNRGRNPDYYASKGIPVIDNVLIKGERKINLNEVRRFIDDDMYLSFIRKYNLENDVLITLVGNGYGNVALSPKEKSIIIQNTIGLRCNNQGDNFFLFYYLLSNRKTLTDLNIGAAQPSIKVGDLLNIELNLPPLPEQKAIAAVLSSLDDKIELLRKENETLEEIAQTLFKRWFVDFNFPDKDGKPYKENGGRMVESELGEIPEGWKVGPINQLINIFSGFAFKSSNFNDNGKYRLVTIKNVQDGRFIADTKDGIEELPKKMPDYCSLANGDILLSLTGNVGRVCLVIGESYLLNQRVAKLSPVNQDDSYFTYCLFRGKDMQNILENLSSGTAQQNLSPVKTGEIEIVIPNRKILDTFAEIGNALTDKINTNNKQIQTLSNLRDTLLPKLMSGDVRVKY